MVECCYYIHSGWLARVMIMLVGAEEVFDQMILFSHYVSSSSSPTSMLMMIQVKEYHLMMVGTVRMW